MAQHDYICNECHYQVTVEHGMLTKDELPEEIKEQIKCPTKDAKFF